MLPFATEMQRIARETGAGTKDGYSIVCWQQAQWEANSWEAEWEEKKQDIGVAQMMEENA